jgi:hypothetical protein
VSIDHALAAEKGKLRLRFGWGDRILKSGSGHQNDGRQIYNVALNNCARRSMSEALASPITK